MESVVLDPIALDATQTAAFRVGDRVRVRTIPGRVREIDAHGRLWVRLLGSVNALPLMPVHVERDEDA